MANLTERITMLELRMRYVEQMLGIEDNTTIPFEIRQTGKKAKEDPEEMINGFTKSQLRTMYGWAKGIKLQQLSKGDFEELKRWKVLKDFYPNAPENYEDITL